MATESNVFVREHKRQRRLFVLLVAIVLLGAFIQRNQRAMFDPGAGIPSAFAAATGDFAEAPGGFLIEPGSPRDRAVLRRFAPGTASRSIPGRAPAGNVVQSPAESLDVPGAGPVAETGPIYNPDAEAGGPNDFGSGAQDLPLPGGSPAGGGAVVPVDPGPGAVPEPETWALMILGLAIVAYRLRHQLKLNPALG